MFDILANFGVLGLGTLMGSLLFLGALLWVLIDNSSLEEVSRQQQDDPVSAAPPSADAGAARRPDRPHHPRRAA